jgi:hypothetical protein
MKRIKVFWYQGVILIVKQLLTVVLITFLEKFIENLCDGKRLDFVSGIVCSKDIRYRYFLSELTLQIRGIKNFNKKGFNKNRLICLT